MAKEKQLEDWEVAIIRAMLASGAYKKQEIVAYFSRPERSINQARVSEIEGNHERYDGIEKVSDEALKKFLSDWRQVRFPTAPIIPQGPTHPDIMARKFPIRKGLATRLHVSETSFVEGKESFNWGSKHKYCKTLAGMANNSGGYLLFGVKDGSFEIPGIEENRMERFDLKKANEFITRNFNQALELEKGQFEVKGKTIGAIFVHPSKSKPVICTTDGNNLFSGDIYYRYPGETRRIQAPELEQLLKSRNSSADGRVLQLVKKLAKTGTHNTAIIDLGTGEVEGERGKFLIEEGLLDKVKFIAQGKFVEKDGAPALRVVGDVQPITAGKVTIQKSVVGSITERHIHEAFLYQRCQYEPTAYIQAQTHMQPVWLPIFYFASVANLDLDGLTDSLNNSDSQYKKRIAKQIDRVKSGKTPAGVPAKTTVQYEYDALLSNEPIKIDDTETAKKYLHAIRILTPDNVGLERVLSVLTDLRARFGNTQALRADFRYAIAAVDVNWFRSKLKT